MAICDIVHGNKVNGLCWLIIVRRDRIDRVIQLLRDPRNSHLGSRSGCVIRLQELQTFEKRVVLIKER